ncbi:uncharacterized protein [Procambarus clarkii]|uniref:uncharacterized protein isoform X2 n=1 Tax=Procambarus clarkii TaxID=6728 RepID=UPI001E671D0A|nr:uncharacterized protein LOC123745514 isoform X2 [Procambarus clarkii]
MALSLNGRTGMAWVVMTAVVAALVTVGHADAGHFFAETPKHLPRIGRRGDLPPLASLLTEDGQTSGPAGPGMTEALGHLDIDGDGCIGITELLRIPVVRMAVLLQNPALLSPDARDESGEMYARDLRPEPRLLRFLQK